MRDSARLHDWQIGKMIRYDYKGVDSKTVYIKVSGNRVPLLIVSPRGRVDSSTGVLWIHGGGYFTGMKEMVYMGRAIDLVKHFGVTVISPGYHLSLFHPYPTAIKECYSSLLFMKKHYKELGITPHQIMIGGESAGGGLTAALCMIARDRGEVNIAFQMPLYPMIDNFDTETSIDNHAKIWNTTRNHFGWKLYLRDRYGKNVSPYAAPARQTDYSNLPPAYTFVSTAEPFLKETKQYIENLKSAGVEAKIDIYEGMYHAFDMMEPECETSKRAISNFMNYFEYAKDTYFAENS